MQTTPDMVIGEDGWCDAALRCPSPNYDVRPEGMVADLLVIHNISLPPGQFGTGCVQDLFLNQLDCDAHPYFDQLRGVRVSSHFLILRTGELVQFVSCNDRAWHAGVSQFDGRERCNDFSVGVELEGTDDMAFEQQQYQALHRLTLALSRRYPIMDVAGHEHIAPVRKTDPGPFFDWQGYQAGICQELQQQKIAVASQIRFPSGIRKSQ